VLVHYAGGGVGLWAIELAHIVGAELIGVASAAKHNFPRGRGVTRLADARAADPVAQVKALTHGRGVDLALDPVGGRSWRQSYDCLAPLGRLGVFGFAAATERPARWLPMLRGRAWSIALSLSSRRRRRTPILAAHAHIEARRNIGKVLLVP
jgi:synaptic vesicle membrane protein VAT-1